MATEGDAEHLQMAAGCCRTLRYRITPSHAYTVIKAQEIKDKNGKSVRLLKIRDPWGTEKYNGPWFDKDENWSQQLRLQTGSVDKNDGVFWVPVDIFEKVFSSFDVTYYRNWKESRVQLKAPSGKKQHFLQFENPVKQNVIVQVEFENERNHPSGCPKIGAKYFFSLHKTVAEVKYSGGYIGLTHTSSRTNFGMLKFGNLDKGTYYVKLDQREENARAHPVVMQTFCMASTCPIEGNIEDDHAL